jgi:hypothetical protein
MRRTISPIRNIMAQGQNSSEGSCASLRRFGRPHTAVCQGRRRFRRRPSPEFSVFRRYNYLQRTRPQLSRQQRRQWRRPQRSRQQRRHCTSVRMLTSVREFAGSGVIGVAWAVPDTAAKIRPATAIASIVRNMCVSLFCALLVAHDLCSARNNAMDEKQDRVGPKSNCSGSEEFGPVSAAHRPRLRC